MSLRELISGVESHEKTLTVVNTDPDVSDALASHFSDRNLTVEAVTVDARAEEFAVLSEDGKFVTAADVGEMLADRDRTDPEFAPGTYEPILDHLDETIFTSYSKSEMVAASREIEDRAWRVGRGELHSGFQTLEVLAGENETYELLGKREDLEVHAYAAPRGEMPDHEGYRIHVERAPEIGETWFVAFDGGGVEEYKSALLAEERGPNEYYGFWSYDPNTVDYIIDHLNSEYGVAESGGTQPA